MYIIFRQNIETKNKTMQMQHRNNKQSENDKLSFREALRRSRKSCAFFEINSDADLDKVVSRCRQICSSSYRYCNFEEKFSRLSSQEQQKIIKKLGKMYHMVYQNASFLREYSALKPDEKDMVTMQILKIYHYGDKTDVKNGKLAEDIKQAYRKKAEQALAFSKIMNDESLHIPIASSSKKLIRWDAYGLIDKVSANNLSDAYRRFRKNKNVNSPVSKQKLMQSYDLFASPAWAYNFAQFYNFGSIENKMREALAEIKVPPKMLKEMNTFDFADVLHTYLANPKYKTAKLFSGTKFEFVKAVAHKNSEKIVDNLRKMNVDERYIRSLLREMKHFGASSNVTPLEYVCTQDAIDYFKTKGLDCSSLTAGKEYPDSFYDILFENKLYDYIVAKDENGNRITGPNFTVHHLTAVDEAGSQKIDGYNHPNLQELESYGNFVLVRSDIHELLLHAFDTVVKYENDNEAYSNRLHLFDSNVAVMCGVDPSSWIYSDFSNERKVIRTAEYHKEYLKKITAAEQSGKLKYVPQQTEEPAGGKKIEIRKAKGCDSQYANTEILSEAIKNMRKRREK